MKCTILYNLQKSFVDSFFADNRTMPTFLEVKLCTVCS